MDQIGGELLGKDADHNDSFEKYYNKDLDLEEGNTLSFNNWLIDQVPIVIYELSESAINFIS